MKVFFIKNPQRSYGELRLYDTIAPTILGTDYKSPPLIIEL